MIRPFDSAARPGLGCRPLLRLFLLLALSVGGVTGAHGDWSEEERAERLGVGDPAAGAGKARASGCLGCHTAAPTRHDGTPVPRLEAQPAAYALAQLARFRSGQRRHPPLDAGPVPLAAEDLEDIAAWFAGQPLPAVADAGPVGDEAGSARLFSRGDRSRDIIACVSCHGAGGRGSVSGSDGYPAIGGQSADYLRARLRSWRAGPQDGGGAGVMNLIARTLSDAEIDALSVWLARLSPSP